MCQKLHPFLLILAGLGLLVILSSACLRIRSSGNQFACKVESKHLEYEYHHTTKPKLRFNSKGTLKLANLADLHYGENPETQWGPEQDRKSTLAINKILEMEKPDFVIFTGDQLTGENMFSNGTEYVNILVAPLVAGGYRWASVYGNHDVGPQVPRESIFQAEAKYDLSYTQHSPPGVAGVTNYFLPIYSKNTTTLNEDEETPVMIWWFFDTRGGRDESGQLPQHMDCTAVSWFQNEHARLVRKWGRLPSLAFMHIPTDEFKAVQKQVPGNPKCSGLVNDTVSPQDKDTGILQALVTTGTVSTVFVGHNHGNAWCCFYESLELCYNRHSGYGGYGKWDRGSRIIQLNESNLDVRLNYIRMENGDVVDRFPKEL